MPAMRRFRSWIVAGSLLMAAVGMAAAEPDDLIASLPEKVAVCGSRTIGREEAGRLLRAGLSPRDPLNRDHLRIRLRNILCQEFYRRELIGILEQKGFPPSPELAETMLRKMLLPGVPGFGPLHAGALQQAAADPDRQLKMAVLAMLEKTVPERLTATPAELERAYRENQMRFYRPARLLREIVTAPGTPAGRQALDAVTVRTALGEPGGAAGDEGMLQWQQEELTGVTASGWDTPKLVDGKYRMQRIRLLRPAGFLPFEQASVILRGEIAEAWAGAELMALMNQIAGERPIRFFF